MISDHGSDVGLIIDWRNGLTLVEGYGRIFLSHQIIGQLEIVLCNLPEELWLNPDTLSDKNIGLDGKTIWLAEPRLQKYNNFAHWKLIVDESVNYLYQNYCR
ncbi:MAG: hypothetical protein ACD_40C00092G0001 [uncultured bacterium]|nr:MAG: hypothetical protein ACD_40C00092G0001 [uncultured bacterium]